MARVVAPLEHVDKRVRAERHANHVEHREAKAIIPGTEWVVQQLHGPLDVLWSRGFRFLFVLDTLALLAIMAGINLVRFGSLSPTYALSYYVGGFAVATAIHLSLNYFVGLYEREPRIGQRPWLPRTLLATSIGVAVQGLAFVILDRYLMPRLNLVIFGLLASVALAANRRLSRVLAVRRKGPPRLVLVGTAADAAMATRHLADSVREATVLGSVESPGHLPDIIQATEATDVLLLDVDAFGAIFPEPLAGLERRGIGFLQRVTARETLLGLQNVCQVAGMPFVRLRVHTVAAHKLMFKRLFDLVVLFITAPIWLTLTALLAVFVLVRTGRPVFYRQERVGRDGRVFRVVKFRTMVPDAEQCGAQLFANRDVRVLPGVAWMRSTRADELPQVFNVLIGQMSLVGPRPERPEIERVIAERVPGYVRRHELPPGLTGLAQIHGYYATDAVYKLGYDLQYLVNWSPILDVQIIVRTAWVVLSRRV